MLHLRYENTRRFGPLLAGSAKVRLSGRTTASRPKTRQRGRNEGACEGVVATHGEARFIVAIIDKNGFVQFERLRGDSFSGVGRAIIAYPGKSLPAFFAVPKICLPLILLALVNIMDNLSRIFRRVMANHSCDLP